MQTSPNAAFDVVERRIQTLTTILQNMNRRHFPTRDPNEVPAFLRHLATLLTCGRKDDPDTKRVIAVTGSLTNEELRIVVATQNPFGSSSVPEFGVKEITKSSGTFEEVVNGDKDAKLSQHIADVWAAIDSYDPNDKDQFDSFCLFIIGRCFRNLSKRIVQDQGYWGVSVSQRIHDWTPLSQELDDVRWVKRPEWALVAIPHGIDGMRERTIEMHGRLVTQWEFSTATLQSWARLLATILKNLELALGRTKEAQERKQIDNETLGLKNINFWCRLLYAYLHWKEDVVWTLLTKTSLAYVFNLSIMGDDPDPDVRADMRQESNDRDGDQVLRHLRAIVAWHAAAKSLLAKKYRRIAQFLRVGLVEVAPSQPDLMTDEEVIQEFFRRRPASSPEVRISIENIIRENYTKKKFTGTTHAEATLMGLFTYFSPGSLSVNYGDKIEDVRLRLLKEFIEPAIFEKAIGVGKKCCWCCDRLGSLLGDIKLAGSHGVLFSWTPPRVGVDVTVLQALENDLWDEINAVVRATICRQIDDEDMVFEEDEIIPVLGERGAEIRDINPRTQLYPPSSKSALSPLLPNWFDWSFLFKALHPGSE